MNIASRRGLLAALLALTVIGGTATVATAASAGSITAEPADPGATSTHTVTVTAGSATAGSLNGIAIDYGNAGADVSNVGQANIKKIGIDRGDDESGTTIDVNVSDDVSDVKITNEGTLLTVKLGGSYSLNASDEVVVVYSGVTNPSSSGSYTVPLDVNPQSSGGQADSTLKIGSTEETTTTTTTEETTTTTTTTEETEQSGEDTTTESGSESQQETTTTSSPGFGAAAALVALAGVTFLALRE